MVTKKELKRVLKELEKVKGRHTELVSVYVPANYNINEIVSFLTSEKGEAENIKSKQTRKNVQSALDRIQRRLKEINKLPKNGLALFSGNASDQEGKVDIKLWEVVPPSPITVRIYRCDKEFVLQPLRDMLDEDNKYVLISIDRSEASIAILKGKSVEIFKNIESNVPGKIKAGGQSQQRFARIREGLYDSFMKSVVETVSNAFLKEIRDKKILGIIISGPGFAKEDLYENYMSEELKKSVISIENTNYAGEDGINELMHKIPEILKEIDLSKEVNVVRKFFENLRKGNGMSIFGIEKTLKALEMGALEKLLVSEKFSGEKIIYMCEKCNYLKESEGMINNLPCDVCGNIMVLKEDEDIIEYLEEKAEGMGTEFHLISTETQEGRQFQNFKIGGILRYKLSDI